MLFYVFWASLYLGLMSLSTEAPSWPGQYAKHPKPLTRSSGKPRGTAKMADGVADTH
jgi:hypothetical protein